MVLVTHLVASDERTVRDVPVGSFRTVQYIEFPHSLVHQDAVDLLRRGFRFFVSQLNGFLVNPERHARKGLKAGWEFGEAVACGTEPVPSQFPVRIRLQVDVRKFALGVVGWAEQFDQLPFPNDRRWLVATPLSPSYRPTRRLDSRSRHTERPADVRDVSLCS